MTGSVDGISEAGTRDLVFGVRWRESQPLGAREYACCGQGFCALGPRAPPARGIGPRVLPVGEPDAVKDRG